MLRTSDPAVCRAIEPCVCGLSMVEYAYVDVAHGMLGHSAGSCGGRTQGSNHTGVGVGSVSGARVGTKDTGDGHVSDAKPCPSGSCVSNSDGSLGNRDKGCTAADGDGKISGAEGEAGQKDLPCNPGGRSRDHKQSGNVEAARSADLTHLHSLACQVCRVRVKI